MIWTTLPAISDTLDTSIPCIQMDNGSRPTANSFFPRTGSFALEDRHPVPDQVCQDLES